jgi:hypothetical protein
VRPSKRIKKLLISRRLLLTGLYPKCCRIVNAVIKQKKGEAAASPFYRFLLILRSLSQIEVVVFCPVRQYRGVNELATASAFPGVEETNKIIEFLGKHTASTFGTFHDWRPP